MQVLDIMKVHIPRRPLIVLGCFLFNGFVALAIYTAAQRTVEGMIRQHVGALARTAALQLDAEDLREVSRTFSPDTDAFRRTLAVLQAIKRANAPTIAWISTFARLPQKNQWLFLVDADPQDADRNGNGVIEEDERGSPPGTPYDSSRSPDMWDCWERPGVDRERFQDAWGSGLSGYAPIRDASGQTVALLSVDVLAPHIDGLLMAVRLVVVVSFLTITTLMISVCFLVVHYRRSNRMLLQQQAELERTQAQLRMSLDRIEADLAYCRDMQRRLLPSDLPSDRTVRFAWHFQASYYASGDYFDVIPLADGRIVVVVADVSGHGTAAAVSMGVVHAILHALDWDRQLGDHPGALGQCLERLNEKFFLLLPTNQFVTMALGVLSADRRLLRYSLAGHPPILHFDAVTGTTRELPRCGNMPLKIVADAAFADSSVDLASGDRVVLYSDGVYEARNAQGEAFGEERLRQSVNRSGRERAEGLVARIVSDVQAYMDGAVPADDLTLLVVEIV